MDLPSTADHECPATVHATARKSQPTHAHAMRVLLVEDDPMIGKAVQQGLRNAGFSVDWVQTGPDAELEGADEARDGRGAEREGVRRGFPEVGHAPRDTGKN